jgi:hypothetical protein
MDIYMVKQKDQKYFFYEDGTNIVISYRWHKSHFYAGGTNVIF